MHRSEIDQISFEQEYRKLQEHYLLDFPSQQVSLFLRRMSFVAPIKFRPLPLLKMLTDITKEILLNEIELAMWAVILETVVWTEIAYFDKWTLLHSAFAAKHYSNEDVSFSQRFLESKYPDFLITYTEWLWKIKEHLIVTPKKLNKMYIILTTPNTREEPLLDYNYYVDEILETSPASSIEKEPKIQFVPEAKVEEEFKLPELMPLNSVLEECQADMEPVVLQRGFSLYGQDAEYKLEPLSDIQLEERISK